MSGLHRNRSTNVTDPKSRPVLVPGGNKARSTDVLTPASKPLKKTEKPLLETDTEAKQTKLIAHSNPQCVSVSRILKRPDHHQAVLNLSMNASCSSDASSTDSSTHSRASSSGKVVRRVSVPVRKKQTKTEKVGSDNVAANDTPVLDSTDSLEGKKRCGWVTPNTEPCYVAFHDEEWGVPVHDDKKLFELLSLSGALAELTWPAILSKRQLFREVFLEFDPRAVSRMNEKKIVAPSSPASSLLSELRLRGIIENARQMCKIIEEFGSFDTYIWNFVNHNSIVSQFRYPRQVPVKSPKAEFISKDLLRRGFRSVGPTVIYTFMQVAGLTNDHLSSCFRFKECITDADSMEKDSSLNSKVKEKATEEPSEVGLLLAKVDKLSFTSE